jgi:hypothetical protein
MHFDGSGGNMTPERCKHGLEDNIKMYIKGEK